MPGNLDSARGLRLAIELVKNRSTREPDAEITARLFEETRRQGLVPSRSGPYRSVLRIVPPLCLSLGDVDAIADGFERCFARI